MQLTAAQKRKAEEGAEYETAVTRATRQAQDKVSSAQRQMAQAQAELSKLQEASRALRERVSQTGGAAAAPPAAPEPAAPAAAEKKLPKVGKNDPCPCGSGKLYRKCHGKEVAA